MPRNIPECPSDWQPPRPDSGRGYEIELITPMFGGGVTAGKVDPDFLIRPTSIRGQLQFWWRATVGAQYATKERLREEQSRVWGDTTRASRVQVRVELLDKPSEPKPCARYDMDRNRPGMFRSMPTWNAPFNSSALPYALFPFQGQLSKDRKSIEVPPAPFINEAKFRLKLICPDDLWSQVEPALWAWVNFGGLGSRTRRGCGAINGREGEFDSKCKLIRTIKYFAPKDAADLAEMWKQYMPSRFPQREWPTLAEAVLVGKEFNSAIDAWNEVIKILRDFRQGEGVGRNPGEQNRPGRSRWPEPETIRRVTQQRHSQHARMQNVPDDAFPRAELGLPIVFHFKDKGEPPDTVLYPEAGSEGKRERMASPLVLKPLALASGKAVPLILWLQTPALTGVDLRRGDTSLGLPPTTVIRDPRLSDYQDSPLNRKQFAKPEDRDKVVESGSALDAFLAFARAEGFTEVTR